jgi:hypothetical protein
MTGWLSPLSHTERMRRPIEWRFVADRFGLVLLLSSWLLFALAVAGAAFQRGSADLFSDTELYWQATATWVAGGDPWSVTRNGITFLGWPPTLLLNLPLLPFGERAAMVWPIAGLAGMVYAIRHYRLPMWWLLFPSFVEGWLSGSPDYALLALLILGGGAVAVATKPYAIPAIIAQGRWHAVAVGLALVAASVLILPWGQYFARRSAIEGTLVATSHNVSAWGDPALMGLTAIALASLGWRRALFLAVPGLWPGAQPHYAIFSIGEAARSKWLAFVLGLPFPSSAALGIIVYAVARKVWQRVAPVDATRLRRANRLPSSIGQAGTVAQVPDRTRVG